MGSSIANTKISGLAGWAIAAWQRTRERSAVQELELLQTISLGGRKQLSLVKCGGHKFLVGSGNESVTSIVSVSEPTGLDKPNWEAGF